MPWSDRARIAATRAATASQRSDGRIRSLGSWMRTHSDSGRFAGSTLPSTFRFFV